MCPFKPGESTWPGRKESNLADPGFSGRWGPGGLNPRWLRGRCHDAIMDHGSDPSPSVAGRRSEPSLGNDVRDEPGHVHGDRGRVLADPDAARLVSNDPAPDDRMAVLGLEELGRLLHDERAV